MLEYKGYLGHVEFDEEAEFFHGEVVNTDDIITFQGTSVAELKQALRDSVEVYLDFCASRGEEPDPPYSGSLVVTVPPEIQKQINWAAKQENKNLNTWILEQIQAAARNALLRFSVQP